MTQFLTNPLKESRIKNFLWGLNNTWILYTNIKITTLNSTNFSKQSINIPKVRILNGKYMFCSMCYSRPTWIKLILLKKCWGSSTIMNSTIKPILKSFSTLKLWVKISTLRIRFWIRITSWNQTHSKITKNLKSSDPSSKNY